MSNFSRLVSVLSVALLVLVLLTILWLDRPTYTTDGIPSFSATDAADGHALLEMQHPAPIAIRK